MRRLPAYPVQPNRSSWRAVIDRRSDTRRSRLPVVTQSYRDLWYGLSLAYRISPATRSV